VLPTTTALYSADDHMIEPAHLWADRVPERFTDRCPRIVDPGNGRQAWLFEDELVYIPMGSCRPLEGLPVQGYPPAPGTARFDEIRPGCYDPVARVADMDLDGVWGQLCFPNYARFAGHRFYLNVSDRDLGYACLATYNDYLLDEWCATAPDRLFGAVILPLDDVTLAVDELKRVIAKGAKAVAFSENPTVMGLPSIHTDHWDPILAVAREAGLPICMHIGSSSRLITTSDDAPATVLTSLNGLNSMCAGVDWLLGGVLERFPGLNVILSEGGAGWVPYVLERADKAFFDHRMDTNLEVGQKFKGKVPPSQLFAEHMYVCLVDEHFALRALGDIPVDNLLWEGDFPHGDGLWPDNRSTMEKSLVDVPDGDAEKIMETNFRRVFSI
jgi:predicted TIM-barrel fold metal-dependent hydrolase